jgi:hypothetical protein
VKIVPMPPPPFAPEIPHAEVELAGAVVHEEDVLPGDGYDDISSHFARLRMSSCTPRCSAIWWLGRRSGWPKEVIERLYGRRRGALDRGARSKVARDARGAGGSARRDAVD